MPPTSSIARPSIRTLPARDRVPRESLKPNNCPSLRSAKRAENHHSDARFVIAQTRPDRVDCLRSLTANVSSSNDFVIAELVRNDPGHGTTDPQLKVGSYAACVHLTKLDDFDVWCDDHHTSPRSIPAGAVHIGDMRHAWRADIRSAFHVVNFCILQSTLDAVASEHGESGMGELVCPISSVRIDTVLKNLTLALLPALARPEQTNKLFVDYAARAAIVHLAKSYGSLRVRDQYGSGGLAPWQERRAKELLMTDLSGNVGLRELASACRLSASHFSQAFRRTVGSPPHQWLLAQRVERAKQLLLNTNQPLSEIALTTGFADQSHFTRVFTQRVKSSPAAWRRAEAR